MSYENKRDKLKKKLRANRPKIMVKNIFQTKQQEESIRLK